jgi:hypothetical protein
VLNTPVDRIRCSLVGELRVPARVSSLSVQPSPLPGRVGVHITTFEACSSFTRVTACRVAHPPYVGFIARLRPSQFPGSDARKLPSSTNNLLGWVLPPLVICAVEAHPVSPSFGHHCPVHQRCITNGSFVFTLREKFRLVAEPSYLPGEDENLRTVLALLEYDSGKALLHGRFSLRQARWFRSR